MRAMFMALVGAAALAGCTTVVDNPAENVRAQAWAQIDHITDVTELGSNRLRVTASAAPGYGVEALETDLLARIAGESVLRGAPRFSVVYLEYSDAGVTDFFAPSDDRTGTRGWIGSYEDMVAARDEQDYDGSLDRNMRFKEVSAVVRMLAPGELQDREAFPSESLYEALLNDRIQRRNIKPATRVTAPKLPSLPSFRRNSDG